MSAGWLILATSLLPVPVTASAGAGSSLAAAAAASGRPRECTSGSRALARGPSVWQTARQPNLGRYCDLLARAAAQLGSNPDAARESATQADQVLPGRAAPSVLLARASLALGSAPDAAKAFERARSIDPRSVGDPSTLHDLARTLLRTGKRDEALSIYRALVPRIDLLGSADRRVSVLIEAAHASMAVEGTAGPTPGATSPSGASKGQRRRLDEAIAYLREARQRSPTLLAGDVLLSLVLVLDRAGEGEDAEAAFADAQRSSAHTRTGPLDYLAAREDKDALDALVLEETDRAGAMKAWEGYLGGPGGKGPWAAAAKARLEGLRKGAARSPKKDLQGGQAGRGGKPR